MSKALLSGLVFCLLLTAGQQLWAGQVTGFIYHRFDEDRYPSTNISTAIFRQQLTVLKQQNYQVLSLAEVARRLQADEALPARGAAISIDDAFTSFAEVAMPIIREFDFPVTLFVNTDSVGTPGYLDWSQLKKLYDEGVEIGNHTSSHAYLVDLADGEQRADWSLRVTREIVKAKEQLEEHLGPVPAIFAYPYGEYNPQLIRILTDLGFTAAFAQQSGVIHGQSSRFTLPRFPMGGPFATLAGFKDKLAMKPLLVVAEQPVSPLLADNPPLLKVQIVDPAADLRQINCFVQGDNSCQVTPLAAQPGWFQVIAAAPLTGRRNKYTLTVAGRQGGWHWYSHLWLQPDNAAAVAE